MMFHDRTQAGRLLAAKLATFKAERPIVLGLARGGVPVALEVARLLDAELDVVVVCAECATRREDAEDADRAARKRPRIIVPG